MPHSERGGGVTAARRICTPLAPRGWCLVQTTAGGTTSRCRGRSKQGSSSSSSPRAAGVMPRIVDPRYGQRTPNPEEVAVQHSDIWCPPLGPRR